jgi:hypothetical protein
VNLVRHLGSLSDGERINQAPRLWNRRLSLSCYAPNGWQVGVNGSRIPGRERYHGSA